jgi:hypothetical protein
MSERELQSLPNVGPAVARLLNRLGLERAADLRGRDPAELFTRLCALDGRRHDPCLLDTLTAVVDFANGGLARPWWYYSRRRKAAAQPDPAAPGRPGGEPVPAGGTERRAGERSS